MLREFRGLTRVSHCQDVVVLAKTERVPGCRLVYPRTNPSLIGITTPVTWSDRSVAKNSTPRSRDSTARHDAGEPQPANPFTQVFCSPSLSDIQHPATRPARNDHR